MTFDEQRRLETYKSLMLYGSLGLKFVLIANGAASIALMTFLGHFVAQGNTKPHNLLIPLGLFLLGVFLGGLATLFAFLTQSKAYHEEEGMVSCQSTEASNFYPMIRNWSPTTKITFWLKVCGVLCFGLGALGAVVALP